MFPIPRRQTSSRTQRRVRLLEELESRLVPTANLFVDFGDFFPAGGLQMTALQLRDTFGNGGVQGPDVRTPDNANTAFDESITDSTGLTFRRTSTLVTFDYNGDSVVNNADYISLRDNVMSLIQRYYAPFDVNVILAPAVDNTSSATYITGVQTFLQAGAATDGERDCWEFVADIVRTSDLFSVGQLNNANGIAAAVDIGNNNTRDDSAVIFSDQILVGLGTIAQADTRLGYTTAHEAGHTFGLQHTWNGGRENIVGVTTGAAGNASFTVPGNRVPDLVIGNQITVAGSTGNDATYTIRAGSSYNAGTGQTTLNVNEAVGNPTADGAITFNYTTDTALTNRSDLIVGSAGTVNRVNLDFFTRYPLATDDPLAGSGNRPTVVDYDRLADPNVLGVRAGFGDYITGTGAFDVITVTRVDATTANVSVQAHRDNSFANPIGSPYLYQVNYTNGLLIESGFADDRLIIDVNLGVTVTFRGMGGSDDELILTGDNTSSGTFAPAGVVNNGLDDNPDHRGVVTITGGFGTTTINLEEFSDDGFVLAQNLASFSYTSPNPNDTLNILSPAAGVNMIDGTSGTATLINLRLSGVNTFTLDAGTNDAGVGVDSVFISTAGFVATGLQNVSLLFGPGDDTLSNSSLSLALPVSGGTLSAAFQGGSDTLIDSTTRTNQWSVTGGALGNLNTELAFNAVENLRGGIGDDTFSFATPGFILGTLEGRDGTDTLVADNAGRTFTLTGADLGTVDTLIGEFFSGIENLTGGNGSDSFVFQDGTSLSGNINGGGGTEDAITGDSGGRTFTLGAGTGTISAILGGIFQNVENLFGGSGADRFAFGPGGEIDGDIDGQGGSDVLDYSAYDDDVFTDLANLVSSGIGGNFADLESFIGSTGDFDLFRGPDDDNVWTFDGDASGNVDNLHFFLDYEDFLGGSNDDRFTFLPGGSILGDIDGDDGTDLFDFSAIGSQTVVLTNVGLYDDFDGYTASFIPIGGFFANMNGVIGSAADDQDLLVNDLGAAAQWRVNAIDAGEFEDVATGTLFTFSATEFLTGSDAIDTFTLVAGAQITGRIEGGGAADLLILRGSAGVDSMELRPNEISLNTRETEFLQIEQVRMLGQAGPDRFIVRFDQGNPLPVQGLRIQGGGGADLLTTIGGAGADVMALKVNHLAVGGRVIAFATLEQMKLYGGAGNDVFDARALVYQAGLQLVQFYGEEGNDRITLAPSLTTRFFIHGGEPARPNFPGDSLRFVKNG
ncbi:MAG: hypothetical protein U0840_29570, partial [Gemmataceae bacterium]